MAVVTTEYATHIEIRLDYPEADCWVCGADATLDNCGIPHYEDFILPNDWQGEWSGVPACRACFEKQGRLTTPTPLAQFRKDS